jgi:excisionase family DNA binding protein
MTEHNENESSSIPGYISTKQAARLLGVSNHRLYQYVKAGRLPVVRVGKAFMLRIEDVEGFKPYPSGRMRTKGASWREYKSRSTMLAMDIHVPVRHGQQALLVEKLRAIRKTDQHTFSGTVARYVIKGNESFTTLHIMLIWKDIEMPSEAIRQEDLSAFQEDLNDVLDWGKAEYSMNEMIIHT